jgi:hypothetical protein
MILFGAAVDCCTTRTVEGLQVVLLLLEDDVVVS